MFQAVGPNGTACQHSPVTWSNSTLVSKGGGHLADQRVPGISGTVGAEHYGQENPPPFHTFGSYILFTMLCAEVGNALPTDSIAWWILCMKGGGTWTPCAAIHYWEQGSVFLDSALPPRYLTSV